LAIFEKSLGCGHCHLHEACPMADAADGDLPDAGPAGQGLGLVMSAMVVFLLPLATGMVGAFIVGKWLADSPIGSLGWWQAGGMTGGLAVGVILARLLLASVRRPVGHVLNSSDSGKFLAGLPGALGSRVEKSK